VLNGEEGKEGRRSESDDGDYPQAIKKAAAETGRRGNATSYPLSSPTTSCFVPMIVEYAGMAKGEGECYDCVG